MSTSPFAPVTLNGVSQYSADLQNILNRAVQIAQIPAFALQSKDSEVLQKETALASLESAVSDLSDSLQSLGTVAAGQALSATSSDSSVISVTNAGSTAPAVYTINSITSAAAAASERSLSSYADSASTPVSSTGTMQLVAGSQNYTFTLTNNTLVGLRDQINSLGAGVTASILTTSDGNYLSISANATGATTLQLIDDPGGANTQWLTSTNQGTDAVFQLNGINVSQSTNLVNSVIPGLTFTILGSSASPVTLSIQSDRAQLSSALQDFVWKYNALRTALNAQEGPAAGMLSGDTAVTQLGDTMRRLTAYSATSGSIKNLSDLGIEFDSSGQASLNQTTFDTLTDSQISDAFDFLGSATTGLGGFSTDFSQFSDPVTGLIQIEQDGFKTTDQDLQSQITTLTDRIDSMQTNLAAQLQAADALLAGLQSQQQVLTASLQGLNLVLYGKNPNQAV
ncbi:MAG TPA: flagellar filament capping protein FliD [Bryobacteraceae bacterium]|nr:flagellar filament capping protein FliD [Bryobacteraceae bacterium]